MISFKGKKFDLNSFQKDVESGKFVHKQIYQKYEINSRQFYYLIEKFQVLNHVQKDVSYIQLESFRTSISQANKGKVRTEEHISNYRAGISKRKFRNNREVGTWSPSEETRRKMKESNLSTWEELPEKWVQSCIDNSQWFENLRNASRPKRSKEQDRKIVESKVGMPYEIWELVRDEYEVYRARVRTITESQDLSTLENIEKRGKEFHLDHRFSISSGFRGSIPPEIVGNIVNLIMLPAKENLSKSKKNSLSFEELMDLYNGT